MKKIFKIGGFILCGLICVGVGIYFCFFYNKTRVYKCESIYNTTAYSSKKIKDWKKCSIVGVFDCKNCEVKEGFTTKDDNKSYVIMEQLRKNAKKNFTSSYDIIIYELKNKKQLAKYEHSYFKQFIYDADDNIVGLYLVNADEEYHYSSVIYNIKENKSIIEFSEGDNLKEKSNLALNYGFEPYDKSYSHKKIYNNLIIVSKYTGETPYEYLYGLMNFETGEVVIPVINIRLYRTSSGNYMATKRLENNSGNASSLYDSNGQLIYEQNLCKLNPYYVIEDIGNNIMFVDNYRNDYFELMDYSGKVNFSNKIYYSDVFEKIKEGISKSDYKDTYENLTWSSIIIGAYLDGNLRINGNWNPETNTYFISFNLYEETGGVYQRDLVCSINYELNIETGETKCLNY